MIIEESHENESTGITADGIGVWLWRKEEKERSGRIPERVGNLCSSPRKRGTEFMERFRVISFFAARA
jgi:hypothetical protein